MNHACKSRSISLGASGLLALVLGLGLLLSTSVMADITITVDFTNAAKTTFKESGGEAVTPTDSMLVAADKTAILAKIKEKYATIPNVGTVTVTEGAIPAALGPGQYAVSVSGGNAPNGSKWGNAGVDGGPSLVYLGQIKAYKEPGTNAMVTAQADIDTVVGETAAHEVGHRVAKIDHNQQSPATAPNMALMVAGSGITVAQRIADMRSFTAAEIKAIQMNFNKNAAPKAPAPGKNDLPAFNGQPMPNPPGIADDDDSWGAKIWFTGTPGWEAGYINSAGQFVYETANQSPGSDSDPNTTFMGFLFPGVENASWDMASGVAV
jgi:hypothetical protein